MRDESLMGGPEQSKRQAAARAVRAGQLLLGRDGMAAAKTNKPKFGAKSEFVRSLDPGMSAAEVVALAEKRGMKLTAAMVYNIRSAARARGTLETSLTTDKRKAGAKGAATKYRPGSPESQLRAAIAQIGLSRAREILEEVEATFAGR